MYILTHNLYITYNNCVFYIFYSTFNTALSQVRFIKHWSHFIVDTNVQ